MWVVDSVDVERMQVCREALAEVLQQERLAGASLLILANKQDIGGSLTVPEIVAQLDLERLLDKSNRHWNIVKCSGLDGSGVREGFDWIVADIASRIYMLS